ncbi:BamA/TamA family outer membrane protein [Chitinophaga pendula]|uniref:translocation and assembly module lipoprotein TamL n=1 Tax=Chitinophaga TaxID=79328 RepID=UPI000BAEA074|nr:MULTISPECIES: BamA/TamA family outer membrane protein [Chitinophaga]ASZ10340.1 hypothetical protein CK934_04755 [Chitinophaga sp. MD30]UCJ06698.1 BamA/TamA family outer membrane protein [Chitinophaga pendula]
MRSTTKHISTILLTACAALFLHACSTTRSVPEGDRLYTGTTVKWEGKKPKDYSSLKSGLDKRVRPAPNRRFFGMPIKLWLYNLGKEPKPGKKGLNYLLRKKWGEPPVLLSQAKPDYTANVLEQYLVDNGYFKGTVTSAIKNSGEKKAAGIYTATPDQRYYIKSVTYETDSSELGKTVAQTAVNSSLIVKKPYSLDSVKAERQRIHLWLKELGYYYFTQDYLLVEVDSTNQGFVDLYVKVKETTPGIARRKYTMKNVTLYPSYSLEADSSATTGDTVVYKGLNLVDPQKKFKPEVFERSVFLKPDSLYRLSAHNITLQRLVNLGTFKFVRGQFRPVRDSNKLNANFYLTPYPRRSLQAELRGTSKSNNFVGSEIRVTARNRNWLHAANLLELALSGGMEWQTGGRSQQASTNSYSLKGELSVTMPRFFIPFFQNVNLRTPYVPRTRISGSYELFSRANLYNLNAYTVQLQYLWKKSAFLEHNLAPIAITYVLPTKTTAAYDSILKVDPAQRNAISKQFILGSNYTITYNNQSAEKIHGFYLSGNVDVSGNLAGLIVPKKGDTARQIFGNPFAQFVRFGAEGRHYWKLSKGMTWVNRLFAGYGIPYGNSKSLPFIKQYFTGGSSSIRAFRARTLGPGSYHNDTTNLFLANEAGDVKLEFNSELRMHIASVVNAAVFVDAGNIWLRNEVDSKPGSEFKTSRFTSEIAVGAGAGLRIDASIVVVRFDLAFPLRKPWLPEKERWVFKDIRFGDPEWRKENLVLNIAIGYPF